ncbi:BlaI/MecI/CopY family transcriptional regulator [Paenibacillus sp. GSMTC-2017]|uniref:BlaI/MecI/CopY family transcriptional regulator n=1 Tax=Paenibacillus sp. GSMTC-2017 TaxID=2794350 RepID=UPI001E5BCD5B|nr:BlaI/MecI/CopY family transcriptional regulator [Paenibacillus sp. GSMTC-2017]
MSNYKADGEGLTQFFGALEAKIMQILWSSKPLTIKEVQAQLEPDKTVAFNTVMTVMNRLVEKGHLRKEAKARNGLFEPTQTKDQFLEEQTKAVATGLIQEFGNIAVSQFVEAIEDIEPSLLEQLEKRLLEARERRQK